MNNKLNLKKYVKPILIAGAVLIPLGGAGAYAAGKYEQSQREKQRAAYSQIVTKQASNDNVTLKSEDDIKKIVSDNIGVDQANITFEEIYLTNEIRDFDDDYYRGHGGHSKDRIVRNSQSSQSSSETANNSTVTNSSETANNSTQETQNNNDTNSNQTTNNSNTTSSTSNERTYVYKVEARANGLEYDLVIDAKDGKVLEVDVD